MKKLSLYTVFPIITFIYTGCSLHKEIISISPPHYYDKNFGLLQNDVADRAIQQELLAMSLPIEVDMPVGMNTDWTMNITKDLDAFYAHEYVQQAEIITYKYKFDTKFYDHAEWRKAEF